MAKKKTYKAEDKPKIVNEPSVAYGKRSIHIFESFEDQANYELQEMAKLTSEQILQQLRKFINVAYAMHGYSTDHLPDKHCIKIIKTGSEHF